MSDRSDLYLIAIGDQFHAQLAILTGAQSSAQSSLHGIRQWADAHHEAVKTSRRTGVEIDERTASLAATVEAYLSWVEDKRNHVILVEVAQGLSHVLSLICRRSSHDPT